MSSWETRFESIGDNCELGLVQQLRGSDEGMLLKWCRIISHQDLLTLLRTPREKFYRLENLKPAYDDMLIDELSGVLFHTELYSHETDGIREFILKGSDLQEQYNLEYTKRMYLWDKFFLGLKEGRKIYLFKKNDEADLDVGKALVAELRIYNSAVQLLYVVEGPAERIGHVTKVDDNLYLGHIRKFAPYWPVTDTKPEYWDELLNNALAVMDTEGLVSSSIT